VHSGETAPVRAVVKRYLRLAPHVAIPALLIFSGGDKFLELSSTIATVFLGMWRCQGNKKDML
jgi:hypothetical protein